MSRVWKLGARIAFQMSTFRRGQLFCLYSISMEPLVMKRASVAHRFENDVVILRCRWWRITSFAYEKKDDVDTRPSFRRQMKCMMTMMTENVELVSLLSIQIMICHLQLFFSLKKGKEREILFLNFVAPSACHRLLLFACGVINRMPTTTTMRNVRNEDVLLSASGSTKLREFLSRS